MNFNVIFKKPGGRFKVPSRCNKVDPTFLDHRQKTRKSVNCDAFIILCLDILQGIKLIKHKNKKEIDYQFDACCVNKVSLTCKRIGSFPPSYCEVFLSLSTVFYYRAEMI
ncbi:hypothetical protein TNCT_117461 [Trichonephila clavata]|uniref:Uncharacterized protein n=1 Tax=Trichonephila clavata TaxID=2740835 RepID=A0A8X6M5Y9_TRICU|nr:hypothetical protein TNCT_117461 [Trichonephila clavata]